MNMMLTDELYYTFPLFLCYMSALVSRILAVSHTPFPSESTALRGILLTI